MTESARALRRLLVALDASRDSLAALEAAAALASRVGAGAEIVGLFVEDAEVLRLASLPVARIVATSGGAGRAPRAREMERAVQAVATEAKRALERIAERAHVPWSFQVVRGRVAAQVLAAAQEADILCLGCRGHASRRGTRLGGTARAALSEGTGTVLLVGEGAALRPPCAVLFTGTAASERALQVAAGLLGSAAESLEVLVTTGDDAPTLEARIRAATPGRAPRHHDRSLSRAGIEAVVSAAAASGAGTLVLPLDGYLSPSEIESLVRATGLAVLLVH